MDNVYKILIDNVAMGEKFAVNFETQTIKVGNEYLIKDGVYKIALGVDKIKMADFLAEAERLYECYKYSTPSERNDSKGRRYFKALKATELTDDELITGEERELAQAKLEGYILCSILAGVTWELPGWFYKGKNNLILLKEWFK